MSNTIVLTADQVKDMCYEDSDEYVYVEDSGWEQDGKYQFCQYIFSFEGKYYEVYISRSGSPFTDWYYSWDDSDEFEAHEVKRVNVTTTVWETVK